MKRSTPYSNVTFTKTQIRIMIGILVFILLLCGVSAYVITKQNQELAYFKLALQKYQQSVPISEDKNPQVDSQAKAKFQESPGTTDEKTSGQVTTPAALPSIPLVSTQGWRQVSQNGIAYKIPAGYRCVSSFNPIKQDDADCKEIEYRWSTYNGIEMINYIHVIVSDYKGGSRRTQFFNGSTDDCHWLYQEAMFGQVKALQIARDGGLCQGGGGGIVAVVGDKFITISDLNYSYDTKEISRYTTRDTIISTLKPL